MIRSRQSLELVPDEFADIDIDGYSCDDRAARPPPPVEAAGERQREVEEYVVIQMRIYKGKEEDWRIWGTTRAANWEDI